MLGSKLCLTRVMAPIRLGQVSMTGHGNGVRLASEIEEKAEIGLHNEYFIEKEAASARSKSRSQRIQISPYLVSIVFVGSHADFSAVRSPALTLRLRCFATLPPLPVVGLMWSLNWRERRAVAARYPSQLLSLPG